MTTPPAPAIRGPDSELLGPMPLAVDPLELSDGMRSRLLDQRLIFASEHKVDLGDGWRCGVFGTRSLLCGAAPEIFSIIE